MKRRELTESGGGTRGIVPRLLDEVRADDLDRLLEPRSLPKVLRGRPRKRRPNTALISQWAQETYERRAAMEKFFLSPKLQITQIDELKDIA